MVSLFAAPQRVVTDVFVPGIGMELSDSKSSVSESRHCACQIRSATRLHFSGLPRRRLWFCIAEGARCYWFTPCTDGVPRRDTNWTSRICIGKADTPAHQPVEVRRINVRITKRGDGIESLLVGHDIEYIGPGR